MLEFIAGGLVGATLFGGGGGSSGGPSSESMYANAAATRELAKANKDGFVNVKRGLDDLAAATREASWQAIPVAHRTERLECPACGNQVDRECRVINVYASIDWLQVNIGIKAALSCNCEHIVSIKPDETFPESIAQKVRFHGISTESTPALKRIFAEFPHFTRGIVDKIAEKFPVYNLVYLSVDTTMRRVKSVTPQKMWGYETPAAIWDGKD